MIFFAFKKAFRSGIELRLQGRQAEEAFNPAFTRAIVVYRRYRYWCDRSRASSLKFL